MEDNKGITSDQTNPNLLQCYQCGGLVSKEADRCPHCGGYPTKIQSEVHRTKVKSDNLNLVSDLFIYTGLLILVLNSFSRCFLAS